MDSVSEHYNTILAEHYVWLFGGYEFNLQKNTALLDSLKLLTNLPEDAVAVDLGTGPGFFALPLAKAGYKVIALDSCPKLLETLTAQAKDLPITPIEADLLDFSSHIPPTVDLILCMGDTLSHLTDYEKVRKLFQDIFNKLKPGGDFLLSFRDYNIPLSGTDRFIPVRSDENRIFTCFLEYDPTHIRVNDLVYEREAPDKPWTFLKSFYRKLRLRKDPIADGLKEIGFKVEKIEESQGLFTFRARKAK